MVDIYTYLTFLTFVSSAHCDVCYYTDVTGFEESSLCPGTCCGTGIDPCCVDPGSIIAIAIGVFVSLLLLLIVTIICCAERRRSRRNTTGHARLQRRLSGWMEETSNTQNNSSAITNGASSDQAQMPPRYSDLYPHPRSATGNTRTSGTGSEDRRSLISSFGSFFRNSSLRWSARHGVNSGESSREQTPETEIIPSNENNLHEQDTNLIHNQLDDTSVPTVIVSEDSETSIASVQISSLDKANCKIISDSRSSLMKSIVEAVPSVFQTTNM
ncbi:Hypothetical predicted protein [Mytilus galloprovincialis]|uniref:Uncharacterized protein n=1 Tax=Mytilus galloprovincialis TaxID=29158 RepID=A0A8B6DVV4_MYTGA|nr:Hypothetical predicted protein [Mytilus galloprovincialis]